MRLPVESRRKHTQPHRQSTSHLRLIRPSGPEQVPRPDGSGDTSGLRDLEEDRGEGEEDGVDREGDGTEHGDHEGAEFLRGGFDQPIDRSEGDEENSPKPTIHWIP